MNKRLNIFIYLIILLQVVLLFGNTHYVFGSIYGLFEIPLVVIVVFVILKRKNTNSTYKTLGLTTLLFVSFSLWNRCNRIDISDPKTSKEVSILSYNLFFKNKHKAKIINEIVNTDPDILIVQELTSSWVSSLEKSISNKYPYKKLYPKRGTRGLGIYAKFPILKSELYSYCQINTLRVNNKDFILVNAHLASPAIAVENPDKFLSHYKSNYAQRVNQWKKIESELKTRKKEIPVLIAGDLNTMRIEGLYRDIRFRWRDLHAKEGKGFGWTFPNTRNIKYPFLTLDYILYNNKVKGITSKVLKNSSSDHLAIYGKVKI